jgi:hypothetical protein
LNQNQGKDEAAVSQQKEKEEAGDKGMIGAAVRRI